MTMNDVLPMLYETLFGFFALFVLTKVLGKRQMSQLTAFDFISAVIIGELVGNALFDKKAGILDIAYVIFLWGTLLYIVDMITQKFKGSRKLLAGKPSIVIYEGEIIYEEMKKSKIDISELQQLLRTKDVFSLREVEFAILETDGQLSVLKKSAYQTPTKQDLQVKQSKPQLATTLISDGEILQDNLMEADLTEEWLDAELKKQNFNSKNEIFYAELMEGQKPFFLPYKKIKHKDYQSKLNSK